MNKDLRQIQTKRSALVFIVCGGELLLQVLEHQGIEIIDAFGTFVPEGGDVEVLIKTTVAETIGDGYMAVPFGRITSFIDKTDASVELETEVFKVELTSNEKEALTLPTAYFWADRDNLMIDLRLREVHRKLFPLSLGDRPLDIVSHEEQYGKWVDAKLISWLDNHVK